MASFPARPSRSDFGPDVVDTQPVIDPTREISAARFQLMFHQLAGCGLLVPRVAYHFTADNPPALIQRVEAWNPKSLVAAPFDDPNLVRNGVGSYTIEYQPAITDLDGNAVAIAFQWAMAFTAAEDPTTLKHALAGVSVADPSHLNVGIYDAAGALEDGNDVVVVAW